MIRFARTAARAGVRRVADIERDTGPFYDELLDLCDHLIVPWALAARLTGADDPRELVERLWTPRRATVAVTRGEAGCWFRGADSGRKVRHQRAFEVPVVDTTGCGDVFHGVYAAAVAQGMETHSAIARASAAAALKATRRGGQEGVPRRGDIEDFLARQSA
jgi:sugar/nucleoside kinase (ribokinase family)